MKRLALACALLSVAGPAWSDDDSVTRRLFVAASELEKSGQVEPAKRGYRQIVENDPESPWADDALLALARLEWPVDDPEDLGEVWDPARLGRAQKLLEALVGRYVASESAAEATWRLALLLLEPSYVERNPGESVARLVSLPTVYPDSGYAPRALALAATIDEREGRDDRARASAFDLISRWPAREECAAAWLVIGKIFARERRWSDALHALGRAQAIAGPGRRERGEAARLATLVDRLAFRIAAPGDPLAPAPDEIVALDERPADVAAAGEGLLALILPRAGVCEIVGPGGRRSRSSAPGALAVAIDRTGGVWKAGSAVSLPPGSGSFATQTGLEIVGIAPVDVSRAWILDERERRVLLARRDGSVAHRALLPERARPAAVAGDGAGGVWVLDARAGVLYRFDPEGRPLTRIDLSSRLDRAGDLALDPLGNLYLLDVRAKRVQVLDPSGTPLFGVSLPAEGPLAIERPEALAVDASGGVAVYDARERRIVWLR